MSKYLAKSLQDSTYACHAPPHDLPLNLAPTAPLPKTAQVESRGIYHGLPVFGSEVSGKTALVAGANGISGTHMLRVMRDYPNIWKRVWSISRRPAAEEFPSDRFTSHAIDLFNNDYEGVAEQIKEAGIKDVDYAFFYAFMPTEAKDNRTLFREAEELANINGKLFDNFLEGMHLAGLRPKRILLQTGCKGYGQHYGPMVCPLLEDHVPSQRRYKEANFYYAQEDLLWKFCKRTGAEWIESRPSFIVGMLKDNNLNFLSPLLIYAAVSKYQGKTELVFPGDRRGWDKLMDFSAAYHNGLQQQWAMVSPHTGNQAFHTADGSNCAWHRFWPWLADQFGLSTSPPPADDDPKANYQTIEMYQDCEIGYPLRVNCKYQFLLADWCADEKNREAWKAMGKEFGLDLTLMGQSYMFAIADFAITVWWPLVLKNKSRKFKYFGTVDTFEGMEEAVKVGRELKIIP